MSELFDQLKTAGPIKKNETLNKTSLSTLNKHDKNVEKFNATHKSKTSSSGNRRDSLPPPVTVNILKKNKGHKARSLSPPKYGVEKVIKSLKVKLERKKLEEFLSRPLDEHANNIRVKHDKLNPKHPKKMTPTKAQQKLFEPSMGGHKKSKSQMLRDFNVKPCKVRVHRDNLKKLLREFKNKKNSKKPSKEGKTFGQKRSATSNSGSPPSKKGKFSSSSPTKSKSNFFIKLNTSPTSKLEKKLKNLSKSSTAVAHHNKIRNSKSTPTTPTKFSRSQLIRSFGERFFNVHVKIERCTHPLMLTFESNDRARRLQAKRNNKSKNLSVSFREQVEIFGGISSDSDDSFDEDFCAVPNRSNRKTTPKSAPTTPVVMPARLKKVENGKVVDDIELDPSLFVDPNNLVASTPFSPGRKKRDHKSYSPLKDECTPSPRKEQLKLANEKIPPSGFRRLNIDEDDDEDDDCEYIVPIEMPQRRTSRTSSNDGVASTSAPQSESTANASAILTDEIEDLTENTNIITDNIDLTEYINNNMNEPKTNTNNQPEILSDDSFQSAKGNDVFTNINKAMPVAVTVAESESEKLPALTTLQTPTLELNDALGIVDEQEANTPTENDHNSPPENGGYDADTNENNVDFNSSNKQMNTMDDDLSMNLFMDDSQSNENDNHTKSFVDSLINETIDKLTKDIDETATDEQFAT